MTVASRDMRLDLLVYVLQNFAIANEAGQVEEALRVPMRRRVPDQRLLVSYFNDLHGREVVGVALSSQ